MLVASLHRQGLLQTGSTLVFLQTGSAARDYYVLPPKEFWTSGNNVWVILSASFGLCNADAELQVQSVGLPCRTGFTDIPLISKLFILEENSKVAAIACISVDDFLAAGSPAVVDPIIKKLKTISS